MLLLLFLTYKLFLLFNPAAIAQIFSHIAEFVIPIGIPSKEDMIEIELHPVIVEAKIKKSSI